MVGNYPVLSDIIGHEIIMFSVYDHQVEVTSHEYIDCKNIEMIIN